MSFEKCSAEVRAKQLEREIWKLMDEGKLEVDHVGYGTINTEADTCRACAIGSAARAVCGLEEVFVPHTLKPSIWSSQGSRKIAYSLEARGVATFEETMQMEAGFEGWAVTNKVEYDPSNPFFQLGQRLHRGKRP